MINDLRAQLRRKPYQQIRRQTTRRHRSTALRFERLEPRLVLSSAPLITEFMASNSSSLADGDGSYSDWIEIYNPTGTAIDLAGWHLTDDADNLNKWTFPNLPQSIVDPGEYLVVFASGQATETYVDPGGNLHTDFAIGAGGEYLGLTDPTEAIVHEYAPSFPAQEVDVSYGLAMESSLTTLVAEGSSARYIVPGGDVPNWNVTGFNDSGWSVGNTAIGYELAPEDYEDFIETPVASGTTSVYLRQSFHVADASDFNSLILHLRYDDGFVAYLNGVKVAEHNAPANPMWNSSATIGHNDPDAVVFAPFDISDHLTNLQDGTNVLAIHALNVTGSSDMLIEPQLTAGTTSLVEPLEAGFLTSPSPGGPNSASFVGFVEDTNFSVDRGFYNGPISVDITTATLGATIVYTTDGSAPTLSNGVQVHAPNANMAPLATVPISSTTVLRAAAFKEDFAPTNVDTQTYIFLADVITSPVLDTSITQNPAYAPYLEQAFTDLPSISLVLPNTPSGVEQQTSVEWISPDGEPGFQIDAGIATYGGEFTHFDKKNFRLYFRGIYGATDLEFPLFEGFDRGLPATDSFDQLELRSGSHDMSQRGFYMSNRFTDDTMLDAGNIAPHGRFVHLYINGVYWGQFHLRERWNADMAADYLGGDDDDYESINGNYNVGGWYVGEAYDGDGSGWENIKSLMGNYEGIRQYMDVQNFIDYMLLYMSGNSENEYRTFGVPDGSVLYQFFLNDADGWLRSVEDRTGDQGPPAGLSGPNGIFGSLVAEGHSDFMTLLADRIHNFFFNDGVLTPEKATARLQERLDEIQVAFIAEAARWGYRTPSSWQSAANDALVNILPNIAPTMIARLIARGLYPNLGAPVFNQHGGEVPIGFQLEMSIETVPTSDNLAFGKPTTQSSDGFGFTGAQAVNGTTADFSHTNTGDLTPFWKVDLQGEAKIETIVVHNRDSCCQERLYNITVDILDEFGNAVYSSPVFNPVAPGGNPTNPGEFLTLDLSGQPEGGVVGHQVRVRKVAVNGSNSSEWLSLGEVVVTGEFTEGQEPGDPRIYYTLDGSDPRLPGGALNPAALEYVSSPVTLTTGVTVSARTLDGDNWSALNEADFTLETPADSTNLRITELHYNPAAPTTAEIAAGFTDNNDFEFIELHNISLESIQLRGVHFSDGVDLTLNDFALLAPSERAVVVGNQAAFELRYGDSIRVLGEWSGRLSNGGETITLTDGNGQVIQSFTFQDGDDPGEEAWPSAPDGSGPSLVVIDTAGNYDDGANWRGSYSTHGSPGSNDVPFLAGDYNRSGSVTENDYSLWKVMFGSTIDLRSDGNGDQVVNAADYVIWRNALGNSATPLGGVGGIASGMPQVGSDGVQSSGLKSTAFSSQFGECTCGQESELLVVSFPITGTKSSATRDASLSYFAMDSGKYTNSQPRAGYRSMNEMTPSDRQVLLLLDGEPSVSARERALLELLDPELLEAEVSESHDLNDPEMPLDIAIGKGWRPLESALNHLR